MPAHYTLRMQFDPRRDIAPVLPELEQLFRQVPVEELMIFVYAEDLNDGHATLEQTRSWLEGVRPIKQLAERMGVKTSLNPWITVLHCDRSRTLRSEQRWQTMVDYTGRATTAVVCPLDKGWQRYYASAMDLFAAERYRVIWIEDDIRYHNHHPLEWGGCFCDLHVAEFNRRAGTGVTREEIVAALVRPGQPHPWRQIWLDMWQETLLEVIAGWRQIVERHGCRLGLMSSIIEEHSMEGRRWDQWWKAIAGDKPPIHRPHFWGYADSCGKTELSRSIGLMDQNRRLEPAGSEVGPEIENHCYYGWNKSNRNTAAQLYLAAIFGSTNYNVSLYDFMGNLPSDDPSRAEFLHRVKPAIAWLEQQFPPTLQSVGIGNVWREDASRRVHTSHAHWNALNVPSRGWTAVLASIGHAFQMADSATVNALGGEQAWALDEGELRQLLSHGLLLDGKAAAILDERGLGELTGLTGVRLVSQSPEMLYSVEEFDHAAFSLRVGAQSTVNLGGAYAQIAQGTPAEGARVISRLLTPDLRQVGHGTVLFENKLGGRVVVLPCDVNAWGGLSMDPQRATALRKALAWAAGGGSTGTAQGGLWLIPQFLTDGKTHRAAIWNGGLDPVTTLKVTAPEGWPAFTKACLVTADGERLEFGITGGEIRPPRSMQQWDVLTLM